MTFKGQLISKCLFVVFTFSQKTNETIRLNTMVPHFLGESEDTKKTFQNYLTFSASKLVPLWPLIKNDPQIIFLFLTKVQQNAINHSTDKRNQYTMGNGTQLNIGKGYEGDLWVIFDQWPKLHLGLNAQSNQKNLKWYLLLNFFLEFSQS